MGDLRQKQKPCLADQHCGKRLKPRINQLSRHITSLAANQRVIVILAESACCYLPRLNHMSRIFNGKSGKLMVDEATIVFLV